MEQNISECCDVCAPTINDDQLMTIANIPHKHVRMEELFGQLLEEHNEVHQNTSLLTFRICNTLTESMVLELENNCDNLFLFDDIQQEI